MILIGCEDHFTPEKFLPLFSFHCLNSQCSASRVLLAENPKNSSLRSSKDTTLTSIISCGSITGDYSESCSRSFSLTLHIHSTVWSEIYYLLLQWALEGKRRGYQSGAILMPAVLFEWTVEVSTLWYIFFKFRFSCFSVSWTLDFF